MLVTNSQTFKQLSTNHKIQQNKTPIKQYKQNNLRILLSLFIILLLPYKCQSASATMASASPFVGILTNYTITIANHSNPSTIRLQFNQWTPWQSLPYSSSSQYFINSGSFSNTLLSCRTRFANTIMQCTIPTPTSFLGPIIQLIITNINNPSSTRPYSVTFILMASGSPDVSITSTLTVTSIRNTDITLTNYTQTVGAISFTNWILSYDYYFDYNTILSIQFNNDLIKINFGSLSGASALPSNTTNLTGISTVRLSNWSDTSRGLRTIGFITVTNPNAAFNTSASCLLYFLQPTNNSIIYQIQSYTIRFSIIPTNFTSITATNILQLGRISQIFAITNSICPLPSRNLSSTNVSYTDIIYSNNLWANSVCTNTGIINNNNYCRYTSSSFPKQISTITQTIIQNASIPITITQYTYFSPLNNYYPLCSQTYTIQLQPQQLVSTSIFFDLSRCTTMKYTGQNNTNTVLVMIVNSVAVGDIVKVYGLLGVMNGMWQLVNNSFYSYTVAAADIINNTHITLPFSYNNPTYLTTNQITNITISRVFGTKPVIYAILISTNPPIPICQTTTPSILQPSTLTPSNSQTYNIYSLSIKLKPKFADYSVSDYLKIQFKYYDNILFLNNINISPNIKATLNVNGAVSNCNLDVISDTVIHIFNISRINNNNAIAQIIVSGLVNPAAIYSIVNNTGFQVIVTTLNGQFDVQKQQVFFQYSIPTNQTAYAYTPLSLQTSQIRSLPILSTQSSFSLTISNSNKPRFFSSMPQSTVTITLPFNCTQTYANGSIRTNLIWQPFSNSINLNLTNCTIGYLTASVAQMIITQLLPINNATYSSIASYTAYRITLQCPDNCLICTSNRYCTRCTNSTYSPYILLHNGQCYVTCPVKTYQPTNQSLCIDCHKSCQTCSGSLFTQCITCPQYYVSKQINITNKQTSVKTLQNICVSICGDNMTFNVVLNRCQSCQIDCVYCIDVNYCYICKEGASIVGDGTCDFLVCTSPCQTCSGSMTNCSTCVNNMYFYQFQCYQQCPKNTYALKSADGSLICQIITSPTLYFPATICSIVFIILVCVCNACIDRGLTADKQRRSINMLTYASSILSYMQFFALIIMLAFTFNSSSIGLGIAGLFIWIVCNIIFGIYYYKVMRVDQKVVVIIEKMSSKSRCIYYFVVVLSILVTLRTYRVLYCGLFRGVAPYPVKKKNNQQTSVKIRKGSQSRIANQDINIKIQDNQQTKPKQQGQQNKDLQKQNEQIKVSTQNRPNNGKNTSMSNKTVLKTITSHQINQFQPQTQMKTTSQLKQPQKPKKNNTIQQLSQNSSINSNVPNSPEHQKFQLKRPYIIYLTIGSVLGSILFLAAGINQIIKQAYIGMLFWGLDLLFVVIGSILCVCFDMWAGIKKSYLIALEKGEQANQTMQNLMMGQEVDEATQQKMLYNTKATQKIGKNLLKKKKSLDNQKQKKKPKKKYELPQSVKPKKSPKNKSPVLSPHQKQLKQKTENLKKIKNRYSDLYKRSRKSDQQRESSNDHDDIPDIKVFEDIQMFTNDEIDKQPEKKIKKIKGDPKRMTSMQNMRRSQNRSVMNATSNQALMKGAKLSWKMEDIFLGFKQDQNLDQQDKKTEKVNDNKPQRQIYQFIRKQIQTKQLQKDSNLGPKQIVLSQKQRKQKEQEKKQSQNKVKPIQFQQ